MKKTHGNFSKLLAVVLTLIMVISSSIFANAATPGKKSFYDTLTTRVYTIRGDLTNSTILNETSAWTLGAGYINTHAEFAIPASSFAAPKATPIYGGVKLVWEAKETMLYTVTVIKDGTVNKYSTYKPEYSLTGLNYNDSISVQISSDEGASGVLNYTCDELAVQSDSGVMKQGYGSTSFVVKFGSVADNFTENSAIVLKIKNEIIPDSVQSVTQTNTTSNKTFSGTTEDAWIGGNIDFNPLTAEGDFYDGKDVACDSTNTEKVYFVNKDGTVLEKDWKNETGQIGAAILNYTPHYRTIIIPASKYKADGIKAIKENGMSIWHTSAQYFIMGYNSNGNLQRTNLQEGMLGSTHNSEKTTNISKLIDRNLIYDVTVIPNYSAYKTNHNLVNNKSFVEYYSASSVPSDTTVEMDAIGKETGTDPNKYKAITSVNMASSYKQVTGGYKDTTDNTASYITPALQYVTAENEKMKLGFTASEAGIYEFTAPMTVDNAEAKVEYRFIKSGADGSYSVVTNWANVGDKALTQTYLNIGDTIYLEAKSNTVGVTIDLGFPQVHLHSITNNVINYRAVDYFNHKVDQDSNVGSTDVVADTTGAWDYGFMATEVQDPFATMEIGADASVVENGLHNYKTVSYYANNIRSFTADVIHNARPGQGGLMHGSALGSQSDWSDGNYKTYEKLLTQSAVFVSENKNTTVTARSDGKKYYVGTWYKFTAPADGTYTLYNSFKKDELMYGDVSITPTEKRFNSGYILKNGTYFKDKSNPAVGESVETFELKAGDEITLCYTSNILVGTNAIVAPRMEMTAATYGSVTFDTKGGTNIANITSETKFNATIELPTSSKAASRFNGWLKNGEGELLTAGTQYVVNGFDTLVADFNYYGDVDKNNKFNSNDLAGICQVILDVETTVDAGLADVNGDSKTNIRDLVRFKKILVELV